MGWDGTNTSGGGGGYTPPAASTLDRRTWVYGMDLSGISNGDSGDFNIAGWTSSMAGSGTAIHLDSPDNGDILLDNDGIYSVSTMLRIRGIETASSAMDLRLRCYFASSGSNNVFDCSARGGDCDEPHPSSSRTYYLSGSSPITCSISYANFDTTEILDVTAFIAVQRLGGTS